jgi:diaminopimelate epimerase
MRFEKWQALGNDYLIVEQHELPFELTAARARRLCEQHTGICADGVLVLHACAGAGAVARLEIYNPDGSQAELSGNGAREAILYLRRRGWTGEDLFTIETAAGEVRATITGTETCKVELGRASLRSKDFPNGGPDGRGELSSGGRSWRFQHVCVGNPQCAIQVEEQDTLEALDLASIGPGIEAHPDFPNRTNVSWYTAVAAGPPERIRVRIFERGVGETRSSGTGASGAAIAHLLRQGRTHGHVSVELDGGVLDVELEDDLTVHLTGWARPVYEGRLSEDLLRELEGLDETK